MINRFSAHLASFICRHPWFVIAIGLCLAGVGGALAYHIDIKSSFSDLLPDQSQAVKDLEAISKRIGGRGTLSIQVEGKNLKAMERFADALVAKLKKYPSSEVLFIDYKIDSQKSFFEHNKYLYPSIDELTKLRDEIQKRVDDEIAKANPFFVDLASDDEKKKKKEEDSKFSLKEKRAEYEKELRRFDKYIDGYLTNEDGTMLIIVIKTPGSTTGVTFAQKFTKKIEDEIAALDPKGFDPSIDAYLTGELKDLPDEYHALRNDIVVMSNLCTGLIILVVLLYFRSLKMTIVLTVGLLSAILTTFGIVYLRIGYLNTATAFLAAIVAGNGINFGIYFLARYMEERTQGGEITDRISRTLSATIISVSTAALAAGTAYASLMATQFKGFNEFGFIGGVGMVVCLIYSLTMIPALIVIVERHMPFKSLSHEKHARGRIFSGASAWAVTRHPKMVFSIGAVALLASGISLVFFFRDPFEYDFRKLRNQYSQKVGSGKKGGATDKILGERSSPHIFLADNVAQVPKIKMALSGYMKTNPDPERQAIKAIKTAQDYVPGTIEEQEKKIALLGEIRELVEGHVFKSLSPEDRAEIERIKPPKDLVPITLASLPEELVRPFTELNGTRGTLMAVDMNGSIWDGPPIFRFARTIREVKLDDGKIVRSSGKVVIFNDMIQHVRNEGPIATLTAFLAVLVLVTVVYRNKRDVLILTVSMMSGVLIMLGGMAALGQKINFLNYIAIPISFGIGIDYTVNLYTRFQQEGPGSIEKVLRSTGGAVMITSLTTIVGFGAMWTSVNGAINSFATLAVLGEVACLSVAVLFAPAAFALFLKGLPKKTA
jgi:uncharacterized protein